MPPGKKRGAKGAKAAEFRLGDLVLAKVKGFPHWPAKVPHSCFTSLIVHVRCCFKFLKMFNS